MREFTQLEQSGHDSVAGMIEKCARVAKVFYDRQQEEDGDDGEVGANSDAKDGDDDEDEDSDGNGDDDDNSDNDGALSGPIGATAAV